MTQPFNAAPTCIRISIYPRVAASADNLRHKLRRKGCRGGTGQGSLDLASDFVGGAGLLRNPVPGADGRPHRLRALYLRHRDHHAGRRLRRAQIPPACRPNHGCGCHDIAHSRQPACTHRRSGPPRLVRRICPVRSCRRGVRPCCHHRFDSHTDRPARRRRHPGWFIPP